MCEGGGRETQGEKVSFVSNANQLRSRVLSDQAMAPYVKILLRFEETLKNSDLNWKYPTSSQPLWSLSLAGWKEKGYLKWVVGAWVFLR